MTATKLSLLPIHVDLQVTRKSPTALSLLFQDAVTGLVENLTADQVAFLAKDKVGGTQKINRAATIADPPSGVATVDLTATDLDDGKTAGLTTWRYAVIRTHGGVPIIWFEGALEIHETVAT